jgi:Rrf2 family protein
MKFITRDTDYAVRALVCMAKEPGQVYCVSELTEELRIPRAFLRRILQVLSKQRVLISRKGKCGGFVLRRPPGSIRIVEVMKIFQGEPKLVECFLGSKICPDRKTCPLRKRLLRIEGRVIAELEEITLASLLAT